MRRLVHLAAALCMITAFPVFAKEKPAAKPKLASKPDTQKSAPAQDPTATAVASCKRHVESMLKESAKTKVSTGSDLRVQPGDGGNVDVSGSVTSRANSGKSKRADFMCHAARYGGSLWTTKTSLSYDR